MNSLNNRPNGLAVSLDFARMPNAQRLEVNNVNQLNLTNAKGVGMDCAVGERFGDRFQQQGSFSIPSNHGEDSVSINLFDQNPKSVICDINREMGF